jgi:ribosomal protein S18 acetylase RimI-like enzyme
MMKKIEQMKIRRRVAKFDDIEFARSVHHKSYHDVIISQFGNWDTEAQDKFFESGWKNGLNHEIILCNNVTCGYCSFEKTDRSLILSELVILPKFQNRGIGSKFLKEKIEEAKTKMIPVKLQVLKANRAADLYEKLGFVKIDETKTHYKMELHSKNSK